MVDECTHICANGQKCRRIPKRGQKYCAAHHPSLRRPRRAFEEDQAFHDAMVAFIDHLDSLPLEQLLNDTRGALSDAHILLDRRCSRRHRAILHRAATAIGIAADRIFEARQAETANAQTRASQKPSARPTPPAPPKTARPLTPAQLAQTQAVSSVLDASPDLSLEQLNNLCSQLLNTFNSNNSTSSTVFSNK